MMTQTSNNPVSNSIQSIVNGLVSIFGKTNSPYSNGTKTA